jgi:hypothetical protein
MFQYDRGQGRARSKESVWEDRYVPIGLECQTGKLAAIIKTGSPTDAAISIDESERQSRNSGSSGSRETVWR